jgi:hypothetical protein
MNPVTSLLWRVRRVLGPVLRRLQGHKIAPDKSTLKLQDREFAGEVNAKPATVRRAFRDDADWTPCWLASVQFETPEDGECKSWEVGSYARRPQGLSGEWQTHVRLTSRDGGKTTALHGHHEKNPWSHPREHYQAIGWDAAAGVGVIRSWVRRQDGFELIE